MKFIVDTSTTLSSLPTITKPDPPRPLLPLPSGASTKYWKRDELGVTLAGSGGASKRQLVIVDYGQHPLIDISQEHPTAPVQIKHHYKLTPSAYYT